VLAERACTKNHGRMDHRANCVISGGGNYSRTPQATEDTEMGDTGWNVLQVVGGYYFEKRPLGAKSGRRRPGRRRAMGRPGSGQLTRNAAGSDRTTARR
jgi:hypothetical protein